MTKNKDSKSERNKIPVSLRKDKSELDYISNKKQATFLTDPRLKEWKNWFLVDNKYPYDMAFSVHHLLLPIREVPEADLSRDEKEELEEILKELSTQYHSRLVNYPSNQSVRYHFHIHLLKFKQNREELIF